MGSLTKKYVDIDAPFPSTITQTIKISLVVDTAEEISVTPSIEISLGWS